MYQGDRQLTVIPAADAVGLIQSAERDMQLMQPFRYAVEVMPEPVCDKQRSAVHAFDNILKGIQLPVVYRNDLAGVIVYRTIRHLRQFIAETCGVGGSDFAVRQRQHQFLPQVAVFLMLRSGKLHGIFAHDQFRHFQVVGRPHGNRDVGYLFIYS